MKWAAKWTGIGAAVFLAVGLMIGADPNKLGELFPTIAISAFLILWMYWNGYKKPGR